MSRRPLQLATAALFVAALYACGAKTTGAPAASPTTVGKRAVPKKGALIDARAQKGGSGKADMKGSTKASDDTLSAASGGGSKDTEDNDCAGVPDGDAICKGSSISVCAGEQEYFLECGSYAAKKGWDSGDCYETNQATDCFGCTTGDDGSTVCCDVDQKNICCDNTGACWKP